jgi:transcriptional regulator with XRE-family HTH domain
MGRQEWTVTTLQQYIDQQIDAEPGLADLIAESDAELELAMQLARMRETRGLTQQGVAKRAKLTQPAVARYEAAGRTPSAIALWRFAHALGANITLQPYYGVSVEPCWSAGASSLAAFTSGHVGAAAEVMVRIALDSYVASASVAPATFGTSEEVACITSGTAAGRPSRERNVQASEVSARAA